MSTKEKRADRELFAILELRDAGHTLSRIARKLRLSRGVVSGCLHRVDHSTDRDRIQEGTMPYGWWRLGLEKEEPSLEMES